MEPTLNNQSSPTVTNTPVAAPEKPQGTSFGELFRFALIALIIVVPIRLYVAQPFIVSGASMEETFATGEYLIVDQVTYHFEAPMRGDVVIFRYPRDPSKFFIKRVIGLPGETVTITDHAVTITNDTYPDGLTLDEPYIKSMHNGDTEMRTELGEHEYFVMGDNRDASSDSRTWGVLPEENIVGRAFARLFPVQTLELLPGEYHDAPQNN